MIEEKSPPSAAPDFIPVSTTSTQSAATGGRTSGGPFKNNSPFGGQPSTSYSKGRGLVSSNRGYYGPPKTTRGGHAHQPFSTTKAGSSRPKRKREGSSNSNDGNDTKNTDSDPNLMPWQTRDYSEGTIG